MSDIMGDLFNVVQYHPDGTYEYTMRAATAMAAVTESRIITQSVGARVGLVKRVMITNMADECCFDWQFGKGIVFPRPEDME